MLIDKNAKKFLQFRSEPIDIATIEQANSCQLPPIYRAFISTFHPYFANTTFLDSESGEEESFTAPIYSSVSKNDYSIDDDELAFEAFIPPEELFQTNSAQHYVKKEGMLPISYHGHGGGLLLGLRGDDIDKIYFTHDSTEKKPIASHILELVQKMQMVTVLYDHRNLDVSRLQQNWNEDFWRIRD